jgi:hypothetical protein
VKKDEGFYCKYLVVVFTCARRISGAVVELLHTTTSGLFIVGCDEIPYPSPKCKLWQMTKPRFKEKRSFQFNVNAIMLPIFSPLNGLCFSPSWMIFCVQLKLKRQGGRSK